MITQTSANGSRSEQQFSTAALEPQKQLLDRMLSVCADVRAGEGRGALVLMLDLFVLLASYYLLKTVRESLILVEGGAEWTAYSSAAQALLLLGVVPLYGWISSRVNRKRLLRWTSLFFASNLVAFYAVGQAGGRIGIAFYIWVGIFNVFTVAQLWAFATDLYSQDQGKRLFPVLGIGASAGAVAGAWFTGGLIHRLGAYNIILIGAGALCVCTSLTALAGRVITRSGRQEEAQKDTEPLSRVGGFELLLKDKYLFLIALLTILLNIVSLSGDFLVRKLVIEQTGHVVGTAASLASARRAYIGEFYSSYYGWTNLVSFVIQTFLVSRIVKRIGVRGSLFVLPVLSLLTFTTVLLQPVLRLVRPLKIVENATNYSLQNTVRQALLLPTSREAKYKAKAAIDTFCVRLGDVLQAGIIALGTRLHFSVQAFSITTLSVTLLWLVVAYLLYREYQHRTDSVPQVESSRQGSSKAAMAVA